MAEVDLRTVTGGDKPGDKPELRDVVQKGLHEDEILVNMGPQHPSTHGVLRVVLKLNGETIVDAYPDIGYLHRGVEKIAEGWTYPQFIPMTDRLDYLAAMSNELTFVLGVEKLMNIEITPRAAYIRVLMAELQRVASHLVWLGAFGGDMGALTVFLYCFREREKILDLFEMVSGARLTYSYMRIGGVRNDLPPGFVEKTRDFVKLMRERLKEYNDLFTGNRIFEARTKGIGPLSAERAIALSAAGPTLRGSGVAYDVRRAEPYLVYDKLDFDVPVGKNGDTYDRYICRIKEISESLKIIEQCLAALPDGEVMAKVPKVIKPPEGEIYSLTEAPRGATGVYIVSNGTGNPYRLHWRAPTFANLQLIPDTLRGFKIADAVMIMGSFDVVLGEVDR
ncbi:MAG: NADH-quinone oxidoreductase subunit D [Bacillota bacterium]